MNEVEDEDPLDFGSNPSQVGVDYGKPLAKGPTTRSMAKHIQEELETSMKVDAKLLFSWVIMEHF